MTPSLPSLMRRSGPAARRELYSVRVHEHTDGRLPVFEGPRRLGRYEADGLPVGGPA